MTLKDKEAKIEQLMKDREMERRQIAKAANQTDEAESNLSLLRDEYLEYKGSQEERAEKMTTQLAKSETKLKRTELALEEEKKKLEDLEFKGPIALAFWMLRFNVRQAVLLQ